MNLPQKVFNWILSFFDEKFDANTIDTSGIVLSDKPKPDNGYQKGVVVGKKTVLLAVHCYGSIGDKIHVNTKQGKVIRTITKITKIKEDTLKDPYFFNGDVSVVEVDEAWPEYVKIFKIASGVKENIKCVCFHQDKTHSIRRIKLNSTKDWIRGSYYEREFKPGDSGLPWFVYQNNEFKVVSILSRGIWGEGCNLSDSTKKTIDSLIE